MDWDSSSSSYSSSDSDSASSESTAPTAALSDNQVATGASDTEPIDDGAADFPFDFATDNINDQADGSESDYVDDGNGATGSLPSTLTPRKQQMISSSLPMFQQEFTNANMTSQGNMTTREESTLSSEAVSSPSDATTGALSIMHRGSLRRIINPSAVHSNHHSNSPSRHNDLQKTEASSTSWPIQQYEFCTRMFALLDTDCQSYIGPECTRNFLYLHCPVVRRRDGAIACQVNKDDCLSSPTVDEIWNTVICCDPKYKTDGATTGPPAPISIEALMQVERERGLSSSCDCIQGWPYCPLPLPELDLDHWLLPRFYFEISEEWDSAKQSIVARRSIADFEWLNQILMSHKRPGHGHLCGRILPPFPTKRASFVPSSSGSQGIQKEVGEKAVSAAKSSVGLITSVAKSLWGSYVSGAGPSTTSPENQHHSGPGAVGNDIPVEVAHAIERYLNYLSENEAFATSFPLNAILQASQTGLESAKQVLQEHFKLHKKEKKMKQDSVSPEGKLSSASTIYNALVRKRASSFAVFHDDDDTPWLRAAAQVAMALQFHGILETTGYESTSAKIQHASLPKFNNAKNSWDEEDNVDTTNNSGSRTKQEGRGSPENVACFETGVVKIESELNNEEDMGYDLLPLPGLSDEQSVLNAGTSVLNTGGTCTIEDSRQFIYRMATDKDVGDKLSTIGTMNVETDIDKVREVLKSVDHTIGKMYNASVNVQKSQHERNAFNASLLRGIDSWCGSSGDVISQRALVAGVAEISTANGNSETSCKNLSNVAENCRNSAHMLLITLDLSWQSSLAASAVSSTAEVRDALKASRTSTRAKTAAFAAAEKAKGAYESCDSSSSKEEVQSSLKTAFVTQSHAIHATVVEYEANLSLKRASVSLAHDVKCWNVHRRKELLQSCIQFAKSQKEACKKASDAWLSLRDGLIDSEYKPLTTVGFDALVNLDTSASQNEPISVITDQYDWNLAESGDSGEALEYPTARNVDNSFESAPSSHSGLFVSKGSLSSTGEEEIVQEGDTYDVTPSDLNVDYDYFAYRQGTIHEDSSEACGDSVKSENEDSEQSSHACESETNESQIICDEVQESNDNCSEGARSSSEGARSMSSSTSMQSLIDGLMAWGEDDGRPDSTENEFLDDTAGTNATEIEKAAWKLLSRAKPLAQHAVALPIAFSHEGVGKREKKRQTSSTNCRQQKNNAPVARSCRNGAQNERANDVMPNLSYKAHSTLLVQFTEETPTWYNCGRNTPGRDETIATYRALGDEIYGHEVALARKNGAANSDKDEKWVESTMKRGTLKDRIAAMSVVVGMDSVHKLYALDMLLDLAGCGVDTRHGELGSIPNARVGQMASEALSDLFTNTLLPKHRKLLSLEARPLYLYEGKRTLSPRVLLLWRYEEMIKQRYASFLTRYLGRTLSGEDEPSKKNAIVTASFLLKDIPEGEEIILPMIVNKIGDPGRKIASAAGHQLRLILEEHPAMTSIVAREALYNCVIFLNQLQLSRDEADDVDAATDGKKREAPKSLPASLISTYFHLFEMTVKKNASGKKKDSKQSATDGAGRLLSALLTGVNRAHPYLPKADATMEEHIDALYRIAHTAPPAAATQALMLLFQLAVGSGDTGAVPQNDESVTARKDRFYRALYSKVADGDMFSGRQLTLFFNLLYKALKYDTKSERICAVLKRLIHSALHLPSSIVCGVLFLLSEIIKCRPEVNNEVEAAVSELIFDPSKREPSVAFPGKVQLEKNLWELSLLAHHYHPSASKFTADSSGKISFKGDPLKDFSLTPFLDKFAFRNPKSLDKQAKQSKGGIAARKSGLSAMAALPMNDPSYLTATDIADEEQFFHQFFVERAKRDEMKGIVRGSGEQDKDESDLEDEALNAAEADVDVDFDANTDSEEEAFVNTLAEKLMENSGNGKANLDEEDPDMDDWRGDDDKEGDFVGAADNEDAFMDAPSSDEEDFEGGVNNDDGSFDDVTRMAISLGYAQAHTDKKKKKKSKSESLYADADEYEKMLADEMRLQTIKKKHLNLVGKRRNAKPNNH
ncbi:CCAAT/enhancer-binding protein zeta [Skeletonema marinoi]|uniref:CCAAT/enhancer-binding protein zeta n=1 Tax=Skeletonema marinoi TaxID=267567 RepID=A0AAD8YH54_9STRA|nr:CCAAT/enhancer-binding protein zeta [Skeletonema marinoi]